jgi:hypothetical protein
MSTLPTMKEVVQFSASTIGRDRINRLLQYLCKFLLALEGTGTPSSSTPTTPAGQGAGPTFYARLRALQAAATQTRKMMRVGRQLEYAWAIQRSATIPDEVVRRTSVLKNLCLGLWLAHDSVHWVGWLDARACVLACVPACSWGVHLLPVDVHLACPPPHAHHPPPTTHPPTPMPTRTQAHSAGILRLRDMQAVAKRGYLFWFLALLTSTLCNGYKLYTNTLLLALNRKYLTAGKDASAPATQAALQAERSGLWLPLVQDTLDMVIPLSGLEWLHAPPALVGLVGVVTSLSGGYQHLRSLRGGS